MVATADLWVYNAENLCVLFFNQVISIFHLQGGKIKKKFFWAYLMYTIRPLLVERYEFKEYTKISTCKYLRALHRTQGARLNSLGTAQSALSPK